MTEPVDSFVGTSVAIRSGPFADLCGEVTEQNGEMLTVSVSIFGRPTPIDVSIGQVDVHVGIRGQARSQLMDHYREYRIFHSRIWWRRRCDEQPDPSDIELAEDWQEGSRVYEESKKYTDSLLAEFDDRFPQDIADEVFAGRWESEQGAWFDAVSYERLDTDDLNEEALARLKAAEEAYKSQRKKR